jgi:hypothetical protein
MKALTTICFVLVCTISCAQKKGAGYFSLAVGLDFPVSSNQEDPAFGFLLSGNGQLAPGSYLGIESGVVKFPGRNGLYVPLQLKLTVETNQDVTRVSPLVILAPGLGAYNSSDGVIDSKGGFVFFGGIGLSFPGKNKNKGFIAAGYSRFGFHDGDVKSNVETIGIRAGIMFH